MVLATSICMTVETMIAMRIAVFSTVIAAIGSTLSAIVIILLPLLLLLLLLLLLPPPVIVMNLSGLFSLSGCRKELRR